jgi:hypothetical protein
MEQERKEEKLDEEAVVELGRVSEETKGGQFGNLEAGQPHQ